jgi:hypothetical protein
MTSTDFGRYGDAPNGNTGSLGTVVIRVGAVHRDGSVKATFTLPAGSTDQRVAVVGAGLVLRRGSAESGGMTAEQRDGVLAELDAARRELFVAHLSLGGPPGPGTA